MQIKNLKPRQSSNSPVPKLRLPPLNRHKDTPISAARLKVPSRRPKKAGSYSVKITKSRRLANRSQQLSSMRGGANTTRNVSAEDRAKFMLIKALKNEIKTNQIKLSKKALERERIKRKLESSTMLIGEFWTEKFRKQLVNMYLENSKKITPGGLSHALLRFKSDSAYIRPGLVDKGEKEMKFDKSLIFSTLESEDEEETGRKKRRKGKRNRGSGNNSPGKKMSSAVSRSEESSSGVGSPTKSRREPPALQRDPKTVNYKAKNINNTKEQTFLDVRRHRLSGVFQAVAKTIGAFQKPRRSRRMSKKPQEIIPIIHAKHAPRRAGFLFAMDKIDKFIRNDIYKYLLVKIKSKILFKFFFNFSNFFS